MGDETVELQIVRLRSMIEKIEGWMLGEEQTIVDRTLKGNMRLQWGGSFLYKKYI